MTDAKRKRASSTISFDVNSEDALKAHDYLTSFGRRQGRFITALILFYLKHQDRLFYSAESGKIWDLKAIMPYVNELGYSYDNDPKKAVSLVERLDSLDKETLDLLERLVSSSSGEKISLGFSGDCLANELFNTFPKGIQFSALNVASVNDDISKSSANNNTDTQASFQNSINKGANTDALSDKKILQSLPADDDDDDDDADFFSQMSFH